jgi:hypothetical protein
MLLLVVVAIVSSGCLHYTTIDVNSTATSGETPIMRSLGDNMLNACMFLMEKGANLFMKNKDGERAIDVHTYRHHGGVVLGP